MSHCTACISEKELQTMITRRPELSESLKHKGYLTEKEMDEAGIKKSRIRGETVNLKIKESLTNKDQWSSIHLKFC